MTVHEVIEEFNPEYILERERKNGTEDKNQWIPVAEKVRECMHNMSGLILTQNTLKDKEEAIKRFQELKKSSGKR
jgi:hypothetical protein